MRILIKYLSILMFVTSCYLFFLFVVPYQIGFKEQMQMFVYNSSYLLSYFSKPAVFACLGGDFFTQFLFFKAGGAAVVTLLLATEWWLIYLTLKRFSVKTQHTTSSIVTLYVVALLPVIVEWMFLPTYQFSLDLSVSFIIALASFLIYAKTERKVSIITGFLLIPVLYWIAGTSVFLFIILVVLYDIYCGRKRYIYLAVCLAAGIFLPLLIRHSYLLTLKQAYIYPYPSVNHGLSIIVLAVIVLLYVCFRNLKFKILKPAVMLFAFVSLLLLISRLVQTTDKDRENLFGMIIETHDENWDRVLSISEKAALNNFVATIYTNIALSQKSLLGERLFDFYQPFTSGLMPRFTASTNVIENLTASDVYYYLGDMDMAQRGTLFALISSPKKRSAQLVGRLVDINLSIGDTTAANKYIQMLESTLFHKKKIESGNKKSIQRRERVIFNADIIRNEHNILAALELLVKSNPDNLTAVNYLLCYYLLNIDIFSFFEAYTLYGKKESNHIPKVYAEALIIYCTVTGTTDKVADYGIHPDIIRSFSDYNRLYKQSGDNLNLMLERYPNSYWPFYQAAILRRTNN